MESEGDLEGDPLRGINVDAAGGAGKVLKMLADKVSCYTLFVAVVQADPSQTRAEQAASVVPVPAKKEEKKEGVVAKRRADQQACKWAKPVVMAIAQAHPKDNSTNFSTGRTAAALTSTALLPEIGNERALLDEEECELKLRIPRPIIELTYQICLTN
jgi:peptidyl-prolyl cis-trans isomerase-like protein 2